MELPVEDFELVELFLMEHEITASVLLAQLFCIIRNESLGQDTVDLFFGARVKPVITVLLLDLERLFDML